MIEKYIGCTVEIIYQDRCGKLSQRCILVQKVDGGKVRAYCYSSKAPRIFYLNQILAVQPMTKYAI